MITLLLRLKRFCGFIFGIVFFVSGLVKLMDPVGAGLVMKEYFEFLHVDFMNPAARFFGTALALLESVVGAALVTGVWRRTFGLTAVIMQSAFTVLTLFLVIFNPEMDCGCFGEAIHMTHMQTFIKNLILLALILLYYIPKKHLGETRRRKYVSFGIVTLSTAAFMIYSLLYIPAIDFTAYKPGSQLLAAATEEGEGEDIYEAVFTYEKDGMKQDFTLEDLPDSTWTFVSTQTRIKDGYDESSIELSIFDPATETYADSLAEKGKVMVISVYDPEIKDKKWKAILSSATTAQECGFRTLILTTDAAHVPEDVKAYTCDYKTLISLNRSNGGMTYFCDGTLIEKWAERATPDREKMQSLAKADPTEMMIDYESKGSLGFQGFLLYVFAVMLLL